MKKSEVRSTSLEAFKSLDPTKIREIHQKILTAIDVIGSGSYQDIAQQMCIEESKVWKRLNEMEKLELIYRPGTKKVLKSGRQGYIWFRTTKSMPKTEAENKKYTGPAIVEYSRRIKSISDKAKQMDLYE
jgi:predicted transcriptional regulator